MTNRRKSPLMLSYLTAVKVATWKTRLKLFKKEKVMNTETISAVARDCNVRAISFEKSKELTSGQKALMKLIIAKAEAQEMLTRDEILKLYLSTAKRYYSSWSLGSTGRARYQAVTTRELTYDDKWATSQAMQWFKNNLATCIIKGKILAIPIIED